MGENEWDLEYFEKKTKLKQRGYSVVHAAVLRQQTYAEWWRTWLAFFQVGAPPLLAGVGPVRTPLPSSAQIVAPAFLGQDVGIDPPGGHVVGLQR